MPEIVEIHRKFYDKGKKKLIRDFLPYGDIVKYAFKGTFDTGGDKHLSSILVPPGMQLKLLLLRVATQEPTGAKFYIKQTAQTGDLGSSPPGGYDHPTVPAAYIDFPMVEAAGAEVIGPQPLNAPIHVCEGSIDFYVQDPKASPYEYILAYWGVMQ